MVWSINRRILVLCLRRVEETFIVPRIRRRGGAPDRLAALANEILASVLAREAAEVTETPVIELADEAVEIPPAVEVAEIPPAVELEEVDAEIPVVDLTDETAEIPTMVRVVDLSTEEDRGVIEMTKDEAMNLALRSSGTTVIEIPVGDGTFFTVTVSQAERAAMSTDAREASGSGELV
jgi:hypothetical protein